MTDYATVLRRVQSLGLLQRRPGAYCVKIAVLAAALGAVLVGCVMLGDHGVQYALAIVAAIIVTQFMFLGHDAAHRQVFESGKANEWLALLLGTGAGGVSLGWWNAKHSRHHQAPNQVGKDPDIDSAVIRYYDTSVPPRTRLAAFVYSRQGWWFYPLLAFEALNLHVQSVITVATRRGLKHRGVECILLAIRLIGYPAVLFVALPWGTAAAFLGVQLAVTGLYLGSAFAVSHIGMPVVPKDHKIDFFRRQVLMSRNVAGGRLAAFAMGGLNYQIEHHLFPSMPTPNLRLARPIVRSFCAEQDIAYQEVPIHRAWATVAGHLNRVGFKAALTVSCPTAAALR